MSELTERLKKQQSSIGVVQDPSFSLEQRLAEKQRLRERGVHVPAPLDIDRARREQLLAESVGTERLGEPGAGVGIRFDLGLSDTFEEKKGKFLDKFPEGQFEQVFDQPRTSVESRTSTILFRRHPDEDFAEFDARNVDQLEVWADIADMSGEIPATVMEVAVVRGGRLWTQVWKAGAATLGGDALKEAVEQARGYQKETLSEILSRESVRVAFSGGGAAATAFVTGPINALRGSASIAVKPGTGAAQRAAKRIGMPSLLPGQVARSPLIQKMQGQASAVMKTVGDYISNQQQAMARAITKLRAGDLKKVLSGELSDVFDNARSQILNSAILIPRRTLTEAGTSIKQGIAEWDELAKMLVNRSYTRARLIEEPAFDLAMLRGVADKLKQGVRGVGADGKPVQLSQIDPNLDNVINKIMQLDPSLPSTTMPDGTVITGIDQLRAIRSMLWDMKTPPPGEIARKPHTDAGTLYGALTRTMRTPTNTNKEFVNAWRNADAMASGRFSTMEQLMVLEAGKSKRPAELAASLARPNQVDNLRVLHSAMPDSKWREFQEGIRTHFMTPENVDGLTKRLDTFDQSTLDILMTKGDQTALREVGRQIDNLNDTGIRQVLQRQATTATTIDSLVINNDSAAIERILRMAIERPALKDSIRAGMMERIWNEAVSVVDGVRTVSQKSINSQLASLRKSGAIRFLTREDIRTIKDVEVLSRFVPTAADSGTSLQAGQAVAGLRSLSGEALRTIIEHISLGRVLTSTWFQRAALGKGKRPLQFNSIRIIGSVLAREHEKLQREKIPEEQP